MSAIVIRPDDLTVNNTPAANAQATISTAAPNAAARLIATGILLSLSGSGATAAPIQWFLRDGATGVGAVLLTGFLSIVAGTAAVVAMSDISVPGSAGNVLTLEFGAAGGANTQESVSLLYNREDTRG